MGDDCEDESYCTVVVVDGDEWVIRFDHQYGTMWGDWRFDDEADMHIT